MLDDGLGRDVSVVRGVSENIAIKLKKNLEFAMFSDNPHIQTLSFWSLDSIEKPTTTWVFLFL